MRRVLPALRLQHILFWPSLPIPSPSKEAPGCVSANIYVVGPSIANCLFALRTSVAARSLSPRS